MIQVGGTPRRVVDRHVLGRMTAAMTHRGPDDLGLHLAPGIALGVRRLSIVDIAGGHQPCANEDGTVLAIQNGEIYNHAALRTALCGNAHRFASRCDTEVVPHAYEDDPDGFERRLQGMFAVAVWDARRRRAVLVRDRLGIKPLYWARRGDLVVFASELKSLLASGLIEPELDHDAIAAFLTFGFFPGPRTPLAGVSKLSPGHRLVVADGLCGLDRYWSYPPPEPDTSVDPATHADRLLEALDRSVCMQLMADVPVGAMLSGGLDSSLVVALMARHTDRVRTFSIGFAGAGDENELEDARLVAKLFDTEHHELELSFDEEAVALDELVWSLDEPLADLSALGFHALSELASRHVKVALSGQGADELVGGYRKHRVAAIAAGWARLPAGARRSAALAARVTSGEARRFVDVLQASSPQERLLAMSAILDADLRSRLFAGPLAAADPNEADRVIADLCTGLAPDEDALAATLHVDAQLALPDDMLHYFDRSSMAHSLEVRVPFLEHDVVELCATIPPGLKVRRSTTKWVLKQAARGLLPDRVVDKRKVPFFHVGGDSATGWFAGQADAALEHYLLDPGARSRELFDRDVLHSLVARRAEGGRRTERLLLSLLMLEVWLSTYVPRALQVADDVPEVVAVPA